MTGGHDFSDRLKTVQSHLSFYSEQGISPVSQDIADLSRHLQRRQSLYRMCGLLPSSFKGAAVLEVGPGSGHNSLFVAACGPARYDLLEPNATAAREIRRLYDGYALPHTPPTLIEKRLEDFAPAGEGWDVVLCEGWLGGNREELALMKKLSGFVKPGGVLVVSYLPPTGVLANMVRRLLARKLDAGIADFAARTDLLVEAFAPHLATMAAMSRPHADWVQDNLINPALLWQPLTPPMIFDTLGPDFQAYGGCPDFGQEWRWYKSLVGDARDYNGPFTATWTTVAHNFVDYRRADITTRDPALNRAFEDRVIDLIAAIATIEEDPTQAAWAEAAELIGAIRDNLRADLPGLAGALDEATGLLGRDGLSAADIAGMTALAPIFGREMCYLATTRTDEAAPWGLP